MKVYKFGGTSVGSAERFRALVPLINDDTQKIVVLSAMAGTTNALVEMSELFSAGKTNEARKKCEALRKQYHSVAGELFASVTWTDKANDLINEHFDYIAGLFSREYSRHNEKRILARGELISTALLHFFLSETGIESKLLPALNFMRIDKDGEPDYFYIRENLKREMATLSDENILDHTGFHLPQRLR